MGYFGLSLILGKKSSENLSFVLKSILGIGLGIGFSSLHYFFWRLLLGEPGKFLVYSETAIFIGVLLAYYLRVRPDIRSQSKLLLNWISRPSAIALVFGLVLTVVVGLNVVGFSKTPQGAWDAWMIWNMKARFLFRGQEDWTNMFSPSVPHADYPLLIPASVARVWTIIGKEARSVPFLIGLLHMVGISTLLVAGLEKIKGRKMGYLAGLTLLISPAYVSQGYYQYADIPLAFYYLLSLFLSFCLTLKRKNHSATYSWQVFSLVLARGQKTKAGCFWCPSS